MLLDTRYCPEDFEEIAEAYAMKSLDDAAAQEFEEHLLICSKCRAAVADADEFVRAMVAAAAEVRRAGR